MQAKPCRPRASTALPHTHVWGSHALHPSLCATAILISSSDSRNPTDVIGGAVSLMLQTVWLCRCQWRRATRPLLHVAQLPICPMPFGCVPTRHMVFGCWTKRSTWSPLRAETRRPVIRQIPGGWTVEGRASMQLKPKRRKAPACAHLLFQVLHV